LPLPLRPLLVGSVRVLLAAMAASAAGCVIPIAPEFESERNVPPFVKTASPEEGTLVTDRSQAFMVLVEDPNRADNLHVAWLIDYPPYVDNVSRRTRSLEVASNGPDEPNEHPLSFQPDCEFDSITPSTTLHRLMLVVSDRPFVNAGPMIYDRTAPGAHVIRVVWTFEKDCRP
jgi:hypothetical protein